MAHLHSHRDGHTRCDDSEATAPDDDRVAQEVHRRLTTVVVRLGPVRHSAAVVQPLVPPTLPVMRRVDARIGSQHLTVKLRQYGKERV